LLSYVGSTTQDAIFLINVIERLPSSEVRWLLRHCRTAIRPNGVCCVLSIEPATPPAISPDGDLPLRPFESAALRALLAESFEAVDTFMWNGWERFEEPGGTGELYGLARAGDAYRIMSPSPSPRRLLSVGEAGWAVAILLERASLPPRFFLRAALHIVAAPPDSVIHIVFRTGDPAQYFWTALSPQRLTANPAALMLASETFTCIGDAKWSDVERVLVRMRSPSAAHFDVRISDLRVLVP
jgi:hypothetical protein